MACPAEQANLAGDDASSVNTRCDTSRCPSNFFVFAHTCTPCPGGTMNLAGDDASGADTACEPRLCGQDQRVQEHTCVACPAGQANLAGDDASGANTQCDAIFCGQNQQVNVHGCVACPLGTTNEAGDDASGADTACEPTLCGQDQRVQAHGCIQCPAGKTNVLGDDASGPDTPCDEICTMAFGLPCVPIEHAYLKASNAGRGDAFGYSVAFDGNTLVVGAPWEDSNATGVGGNQLNSLAYDSGAVYIFTRSGTTWSQQAYLKASNTGAYDRFGHAVALDGDTLVVGAYTEASSATGVGGNQADNAASNSGAAYVFVRSGTTWTQQAYIKASNTDAHDKFGWSVALDGDTLAVGAVGERNSNPGVGSTPINNHATDSGAAYIFVRSGTTWTQQAYIKTSRPGSGFDFGYSMSLDGDTLAVGAAREQSNATGVGGDQLNNLAKGSGAVYIFVRSGTTWAQQAYIKASNTDTNDLFGWSVALDSGTLAVGALGEASSALGVGGNQADNAASNSGAVYIFTRSGTTWSQQAYIKASNTGNRDYFGHSVALDSDTLAVGASGEASSAIGVGGNQADNAAYDSGAVYTFVRSGTTWSQQAYIKASNTDSKDLFGHSVALKGDTLSTGAIGESSSAMGVGGNSADNLGYESGAVYVFKSSP